MKKIAALIMILCLTMAMFAGCGSAAASASASAPAAEAEASQQTEASEAEAAPAAETEAPAAESAAEAESAEEAESAVEEDAFVYEPLSYPLDTDVTFSWFMSYPGVMEIFVEHPFYDYEAWNQWMVDTGVNIDWYLVSGFDTSAEQFNLLMASGDMCDVFMSTFSDSASVDELVEQDLIYDLKDLIPENMPDYMKFINENEEFAACIGTESSEGYWAGLHEYTENLYYSSGLVLRNDWLQDLGMDIPVTYDDLHDVLTAFKNEKGAKNALWINYNGYLPNNDLISGFDTVGAAGTSNDADTPFLQIDGQVYYAATQDGFRQYIELLSDWYAEGLIYSDFISATDSNTQPPSDIVTNGECGVFFQTLDSYHQWDDADPNYELAAFADVRQTEDQVLHFSGTTGATSKNVLCVSTNCEEVETVLQAFNYDFTEEGFTLMNYGIENDTFVYDENGDPQLTDVVLHSELPDVSLALAVYTGTDTNTYCGIRDNGRNWSLYDEDQQAASTVWENGGKDDADYQYPTLCSMNLEESTEFNATYSDIDTYLSEKVLSWITGDADVDAEWDEFVENIEAMGIQKCIDNKQSALDRYYANIPD